ncbi:MAG: CBS domain-containing protein [Elusimicrobia bacterium]|nr:CBS domain-containing protein [Elusimicrobiota bacterium]
MKCPECGFVNIAGADECDSCQAPLVHLEQFSPKQGMERRILQGTVASLAPQAAAKVGPEESLSRAIEAMREAKVGCLLVVDGRKLEGIISERELLFRVPAHADFSKMAVRDAMRPKPTCLQEEDQVADVFNRMAMSGHRHMPVRFKDGSYGVVSARDLLRYLCK